MAREPDQPLISKIDILFLAVLILIGTAVTIGICLPDKKSATHLEIRQNGTVILTLPLDTDREQTIIDKHGGTNRLRIENRSVIMIDADCGDHTCIRTGRISQAGESIVCLPHRLALQITSSGSPAQEQAPDAVVH